MLTTEQGYEPNWLVESLDESVATFAANGGEVVVKPFDIPVGPVAVAADPLRNTLVMVDLSKGRYETDEQGSVTGIS